MTKEELTSEIHNIAEYPNNWDGYGAKKVKEHAITSALMIINLKNIDLNKIEDVYPGENGTIHMNIYGSEGSIHLIINEYTYGYLLEPNHIFREPKLVGSEPFNKLNFEKLINEINDLN